jgi:hypothetical protein
MTQKNNACPLCQAPSTAHAYGPNGTWEWFNCEACGEYHIDRKTKFNIEGASFPIPRHILSGVTRNVWESTGRPFELVDEVTQTLEALQKASPVTIPRREDVVRKSDMILRHLKRKTTYPGEKVSCIRDRAAGFCQNDEEYSYCLAYLSERGYINKIEGPAIKQTWTFRIAPKGWQYLSGDVSDVSSQAFVAMSFETVLDEMWLQGLKKGIEAAGYSPLRIDGKEHNNRIDDEIVAEIRKSRLVVADLARQNSGAYFEAGFALGLGKPVIWTCDQSEVDAKKVHFDTRQYSIVVWKQGEWADLAKRLALRIEATLGRNLVLPDSPCLMQFH